MTVLNAGFDLDAFLFQLAVSARRTLLLDYDGTLAPFVVDRKAAFPYPGLAELLEAIRRDTGTRLIIITGRAIADVDHLLPLGSMPEVWGSHGWEHRARDGSYEMPELSGQARSILSQAMVGARRLGLAEKLEVKPASIAVHWRGSVRREADSIRSQLLQQWQELWVEGLAELKDFDGGIELRLLGRDKGTVVSQILQSGDAGVMAYLGDDATDEDAFGALKGRGLRVLVRAKLRTTLADLWLKPPEELFAFLYRWLSIGTVSSTRDNNLGA